MPQFDVFSMAAAVTALLLAAGFVVAYQINRGLTSFRWWAASFALLAIALATSTLRFELRFDGSSDWIKSLSAAALYAAACVVALGLFREGATRTNPIAAIAACAVLYVAVVSSLIITSAPPHLWFLLGPLPTLTFMTWALWPMLRARAWGYSAILGVGITILATRAIWYTVDLMRMGPPPRPILRGTLPPGGHVPDAVRLGPGRVAHALAGFGPPPGARAPLEQPLTITLFTIGALLALAVALIVRDLLASVRRMRERSTTDAMTGLLNRATFDETVLATLNEATALPVCLVLFDIDHFKRINDTCGHPVGDQVIARLGRILGEMNLLRSVAGRIGGEEFAVLIVGADLRMARLFAESIRAGISSADFEGAVPWTVTLSAGIALRRDQESFKSLIARTDKALYAAKAQGRDRVNLAEDEPIRRARFG